MRCQLVRVAVLVGLLVLAAYAQNTESDPSTSKDEKKLEVADTDGKPIVPLPKECRYYRTLLTLDGGGMRGVLSTQVLKQLVESIKDFLLANQSTLALADAKTRFITKNDFHIDLADYFDAIAGISAGSWIATYIASKGGAKGQSRQIFELKHIKRRFGDIRAGSIKGLDVYFLEYGIYIYPPQAFPIRPKLRWFGLPVPKVDGATTATYAPRGLEWTLDKFLGGTRYSDVKTSLLVVAFDLNMRSTVQFVYDKLQDLEARSDLRKLAKDRNMFENCTTTLKKHSDHDEHDDKKDDEIIEQIIAECNNKQEIFHQKEGDEEKPKKKDNKGTVRTGYVWTRTIPRDLEDADDFAEPGIKYYAGMDYNLKDITRASSAFPMLHPSKNIKPYLDVRHEFDLIDGAMVGNNPTLHALVWMASNPNINLTDIATISIGTGSSIPLMEGLAEAGRLPWTGSIISLVLDSSTEFIQSNIDYLYYMTLKNLFLPNQYLRIQTVGNAGTEKGNILAQANLVTMLPDLYRYGEETAVNNKANIDHFVKEFIFAKCSRPIYGLIEQARIRQQESYLEAAEADYNKTKNDIRSGKSQTPTTEEPEPETEVYEEEIGLADSSEESEYWPPPVEESKTEETEGVKEPGYSDTEYSLFESEKSPPPLLGNSD